ncbi:MAG: S41 family peptidase [Candidatus Acidiferrales bacterium]
MSPLVKKTVVILSVLIMAYVTTGYVLARSSDDKAFRALAVYSEVLDHIQNDYVDQPNIHSVTSGALHGLLDSLDPQSGYMSPLEYNDYEKESASQAAGGAGVALTKRFGYISVISSLPGSPAEKAGLRIGDILEKIAGFTTAQMSVDQAQALLSGAPGTVVALSVVRRGKTEPEDAQITLAKVPAPKLVEDHLQDGIAYLRVSELGDGVTRQIHDTLLQFSHQGARKLILDLRDCASGDDAEGISTAQLFLSSGTIATLKGQTVAPAVSSADPSKVVWKLPMAVLIGNSTAGPAEIVAGAIADNHRGETVGDRTYGTASMQKLIQLDDGSALILTVANYYTPNATEIPADGIVPTEEVAPATDDVAAVSDEYPPAPSSSLDDPVVKKAVDILESASAQPKAA